MFDFLYVIGTGDVKSYSGGEDSSEVLVWATFTYTFNFMVIF